MEEIVIRGSKWKLLYLLAISICFVAAGFWMITDPGGGRGIFAIPGLVVVVGVFSILFFGGGTIFYVYFSFKNGGPRLVINEKGFDDRTNPMAGGFIGWHEVENVSELSVVAQKMVSIAIKQDSPISLDPLLTPKSLKSNRKAGFGNIIAISSGALTISHNQLLQKMTEYWRAHCDNNGGLAPPRYPTI